VSQAPSNPNQVFFGAWVSLETPDGDEHCYRIVGADEIDTSGGLISLDSPLAQALLKKKLDDEVVVRHGDSQRRFYITAIDYTAAKPL
jgi:transcription elongation factor GreB